MRIDDRYRLREYLLDHMMISDDSVYPQCLCVYHFVERRYAIIYRYYQFDSVFCKRVDRFHRQAVACGIPAWQRTDHISSESFQAPVHECCRSKAVNIIITEDRYPLTGFNSSVYPVRGDVHVLEKEGVVGREASVKKLSGLRRFREPSSGQHK